MTIPVRLHAVADVPRTQVEAARSEMESLDRYAGGRLMDARLTLHRGTPRAKRPYVADASVLLDGRKLAAHAAGATPRDAADSVVDRLRRQVRRVVDAEVAQRNEPAAIEAALEALPEPDRRHRPEVRLKPPEERAIVKRRTYAPGPETTLEAIADMIDLDEEFHLFVHARTGEDVVVYRRDDGGIGLIHPRGSALADEDDVVPEPSRYSEPLTMERARTEMDFLNHRFLYFVDADDGRGKAIYLRHDGDYGLVVPE